MTKQPAITSVFPVRATNEAKIKFLKEQIKELEAQKKCYNKMVSDRKRTIGYLKKKQQIKAKRRR